MDALINTHTPDAPDGSFAGERRVRAFRAMDAFAIDTYQALRGGSAPDGEALSKEIRSTVLRVGGALIAACSTAAGSEAERAGLQSARTALFEARYQLYLARRLGFVNLRRYRSISVRHDAVLKEVVALLSPGGRRPP